MKLYSYEEAARILGGGVWKVRKLVAQNKLKTATWKNHVLIVGDDTLGEAA